MFAQLIRGKTSDPKAVRASLDMWMQDLRPGATGYLGTTSGVTDQGDLFALVRFESEEAAKANSGRPEQGEWWAEFSESLDGEATFQDSSDVTVEESGDPGSARFVQVMTGQTSDPERAKALMAADQPDMRSQRPDILGSVTVGHDEGKWTMVLYFTNEDEARQGEQKVMPPEAQKMMEEMMAISVNAPEFLDLKEPWLDSLK